MNIDRINKYGGIMPLELKMLLDDHPKDVCGWALVMYLFENTKSGNIITLGKLSNFFDMDASILSTRLNDMNGLWIRQYLNYSEYGDTYSTYEITEIAADFLIKLVELLEIRKI
jgi:hypothetical protein